MLILVILILLSGFFSAAEAALSAYRSNYLEKLDEEKYPKKDDVEDFIIYENGLKINLKYR